MIELRGAAALSAITDRAMPRRGLDDNNEEWEYLENFTTLARLFA